MKYVEEFKWFFEHGFLNAAEAVLISWLTTHPEKTRKDFKKLLFEIS